MTIFAVQYTYDDRTAERDRVRPEHRAYLRGLADRGQLLGSGPLTTGPAGALLVLRARDEGEVRGLVADDPFTHHGLVAATSVHAWDLVLGPWAPTP